MSENKSTPAKKKRGRPRKPLDTEQIRKDLAEGVSKEDAFRKQNFHQNYASELEKKDEQLAVAVKEGQEEFKGRFTEHIKPLLVSAYKQKVLEGDVAAILYGMRNIVGFTEKRAVELSGEVSHIHTLSPDERVQRIADLRKELETIDVELLEEAPDDSQ